MIGNSDNNRSESQGGVREDVQLKEGRSEGTTVGTRNGSEAAMRAISVLGNAKSDRHRKTHQVEPCGTGRKFMHLTRGGLCRESGRGVSRGHSSEDAPGNRGGAKGRRTKREPSVEDPVWTRREGGRNPAGVATAAASHRSERALGGGFLRPRHERVRPVDNTARAGVR